MVGRELLQNSAEFAKALSNVKIRMMKAKQPVKFQTLMTPAGKKNLQSFGAGGIEEEAQIDTSVSGIHATTAAKTI